MVTVRVTVTVIVAWSPPAEPLDVEFDPNGPPWAPTALNTDLAVASLVQVTTVPSEVNEGNAKHF